MKEPHIQEKPTISVNEPTVMLQNVDLVKQLIDSIAMSFNVTPEKLNQPSSSMYLWNLMMWVYLIHTNATSIKVSSIQWIVKRDVIIEWSWKVGECVHKGIKRYEWFLVIFVPQPLLTSIRNSHSLPDTHMYTSVDEKTGSCVLFKVLSFKLKRESVYTNNRSSLS